MDSEQRRPSIQVGTSQEPPSSEGSTIAKGSTSHELDPSTLNEAGPPVYRLDPIHGKGIGMTASRDIKQGELILRETPLLVIPENEEDYHATCKNVIDSVKTLPPQQYLEFMKLTHHTTQASTEAVRSHNAPYNTNESLEIVSKFATNAFRNKCGQKLHLLVLQASRVNHSCTPNAMWRYNYNAERFNIRAIEDIPLGREITIAYIDTMRTRGKRKSSLNTSFGFDCICEACDIDGSSSAYAAETEIRRHKMYLDTVELGKLRKQPNTESKQVKYLLAILEGMDQEPRMVWEKHLMIKRLAVLHESNALMHLRKAYDYWEWSEHLAAICLGEDHPITQDCRWRKDRANETTSSQEV